MSRDLVQGSNNSSPLLPRWPAAPSSDMMGSLSGMVPVEVSSVISSHHQRDPPQNQSTSFEPASSTRTSMWPPRFPDGSDGTSGRFPVESSNAAPHFSHRMHPEGCDNAPGGSSPLLYSPASAGNPGRPASDQDPDLMLDPIGQTFDYRSSLPPRFLMPDRGVSAASGAAITPQSEGHHRGPFGPPSTSPTHNSHSGPIPGCGTMFHDLRVLLVRSTRRSDGGPPPDIISPNVNSPAGNPQPPSSDRIWIPPRRQGGGGGGGGGGGSTLDSHPRGTRGYNDPFGQVQAAEETDNAAMTIGSFSESEPLVPCDRGLWGGSPGSLEGGGVVSMIMSPPQLTSGFPAAAAADAPDLSLHWPSAHVALALSNNISAGVSAGLQEASCFLGSRQCAATPLPSSTMWAPVPAMDNSMLFKGHTIRPDQQHQVPTTALLTVHCEGVEVMMGTGLDSEPSLCPPLTATGLSEEGGMDAGIDMMFDVEFGLTKSATSAGSDTSEEVPPEDSVESPIGQMLGLWKQQQQLMLPRDPLLLGLDPDLDQHPPDLSVAAACQEPKRSASYYCVNCTLPLVAGASRCAACGLVLRDSRFGDIAVPPCHSSLMTPREGPESTCTMTVEEGDPRRQGDGAGAPSGRRLVDPEALYSSGTDHHRLSSLSGGPTGPIRFDPLG